MPTSVHLPKQLLDRVDRRARKLAMSRNRFIIRALERDLAAETEWSPGFFERLSRAEPDLEAAVDEMLEGVLAHRTRKAPRRL
jgi:predicted transcriptional regulator